MALAVSARSMKTASHWRPCFTTADSRGNYCGRNRRHRLIELFLARTLELSWDEVHEEAENMEHAVSDLLIDRIDEFLGFPKCDPHGDPIPRSDGTVTAPEGRRLPELRVGDRFQLVRVMDQAPEFLRQL